MARHLARISHQPSAAAADPRAVAGRTPSRRFDVVTTTPAAASARWGCAPNPRRLLAGSPSPRAAAAGPRRARLSFDPSRRLDALATNAGEKCGLALLGALLVLPVGLHAQSGAAGQRTPWGDPDLQAVWTSSTLTPLERPAGMADTAALSEEEAAASTALELQRIDGDQRAGTGRGDRQTDTPDGRTDVGRAYNEFWRERGRMLRQTSLIVDPPDGRIPYQPGARPTESPYHGGVGEFPAGPETRGLAERCIAWGSAGPPMQPTTYNSNFQLLQTPDHVAIVNEMIHDVRIVPLDGRPHVGADIRQLLGDSRGRWEGDTLVVVTANFTDKTRFAGSGTGLDLVERFTRVDDDTLLYEYTVRDDSAWAQPWTASWPLSTLQSAIGAEPDSAGAHLFEYACHEGNYGMTNLLAGARALEPARD